VKRPVNGYSVLLKADQISQTLFSIADVTGRIYYAIPAVADGRSTALFFYPID
jgi:hypothetical protein